MKTAAEIQKMIADIDYHITNKTAISNEKKWLAAARRNRRFYYKIMLYLENMPREKFLAKQLHMNTAYIKATNERATPDILSRIYPQLNLRKARAQWRKDNNAPHWQAQVRVLNFILN